MPSFDSVSHKDATLIRKALGGAVFIAPYSADPVLALTESTGSAPDTVVSFAALPDDYEDLGWINDDGATVARDTDTSDVPAWGSTSSVRTDVTSDVKTIQVVALETKRRTLELSSGVDLSAVTADEDTGEITFDEPAAPRQVYYRLLVVGVDKNIESGDVYVAQFFPRANVTEWGDMVFSSGDDPLAYELTFTAYVDPALGYARKHFVGGPGYASIAAASGWS